jgi:hypothetical protein
MQPGTTSCTLLLFLVLPERNNLQQYLTASPNYESETHVILAYIACENRDAWKLMVKFVSETDSARNDFIQLNHS